MERALNIWVVGGDLRQAALARQLSEDGHCVHAFALEQAEGLSCENSLTGIEWADCVILPLPALDENGKLNTPLSRQEYAIEGLLDALEPGQLVCAGMITPDLYRFSKQRGLLIKDYFAREELAVANAIPTAEGAVQIALEELPITLHGARVLILGYGRLGRATAQRMGALGARVTVAARSYEQLTWAQVWGYDTERIDCLLPWLCGYDLIVNTVPARILGSAELAALREGTLVIDLASRPGGVDFTEAARLGVRAIWALSLPGKTAPESSGGYMKCTIYHIMEELGA